MLFTKKLPSIVVSFLHQRFTSAMSSFSLMTLDPKSIMKISSKFVLSNYNLSLSSRIEKVILKP